MDNAQQQQTIPNDKPQQLTFLQLEELTVKTLSSTEQMQEDLKKHREMLKDGYVNNPAFRERQEKVKDAQKSRSEVKAQIDKTEGVRVLKQKVKDLQYDLKERKEALASYAIEFSEASGTDQIERDGQIFTIVKSAKLIKSSKRM